MYHDQKILADPARGDGHNADGVPGDCWKACIASLLQVPVYDDVPHFVELDDGKGSWWQLTNQFVWGMTGRTLMHWRNPKYLPEDQEVFIGTGPSPRGNFHHAVLVDRHGDLIHDPHPSRAGILAVEEYFGLA